MRGGEIFYVVKKCRPNNKPPHTATKQLIRLMAILNRALLNSPIWIYCMVSNEKVEKVVNAPKNPIIINARHSVDASSLSTNNTATSPITNEPSTLTESVPHAKSRPSHWYTWCDMANRAVAPSAPPNAMANQPKILIVAILFPSFICVAYKWLVDLMRQGALF